LSGKGRPITIRRAISAQNGGVDIETLELSKTLRPTTTLSPMRADNQVGKSSLIKR